MQSGNTIYKSKYTYQTLTQQLNDAGQLETKVEAKVIEGDPRPLLQQQNAKNAECVQQIKQLDAKQVAREEALKQVIITLLDAAYKDPNYRTQINKTAENILIHVSKPNHTHPYKKYWSDLKALLYRALTTTEPKLNTEQFEAYSYESFAHDFLSAEPTRALPANWIELTSAVDTFVRETQSYQANKAAIPREEFNFVAHNLTTGAQTISQRGTAAFAYKSFNEDATDSVIIAPCQTATDFAAFDIMVTDEAKPEQLLSTMVANSAAAVADQKLEDGAAAVHTLLYLDPQTGKAKATTAVVGDCRSFAVTVDLTKLRNKQNSKNPPVVVTPLTPKLHGLSHDSHKPLRDLSEDEINRLLQNENIGFVWKNGTWYIFTPPDNFPLQGVQVTQGKESNSLQDLYQLIRDNQPPPQHFDADPTLRFSVWRKGSQEWCCANTAPLDTQFLNMIHSYGDTAAKPLVSADPTITTTTLEAPSSDQNILQFIWDSTDGIDLTKEQIAEVTRNVVADFQERYQQLFEQSPDAADDFILGQIMRALDAEEKQSPHNSRVHDNRTGQIFSLRRLKKGQFVLNSTIDGHGGDKTAHLLVAAAPKQFAEAATATLAACRHEVDTTLSENQPLTQVAVVESQLAYSKLQIRAHQGDVYTVDVVNQATLSGAVPIVHSGDPSIEIARLNQENSARNEKLHQLKEDLVELIEAALAQQAIAAQTQSSKPKQRRHIQISDTDAIKQEAVKRANVLITAIVQSQGPLQPTELQAATNNLPDPTKTKTEIEKLIKDAGLDKPFAASFDVSGYDPATKVGFSTCRGNSPACDVYDAQGKKSKGKRNEDGRFAVKLQLQNATAGADAKEENEELLQKVMLESESLGQEYIRRLNKAIKAKGLESGAAAVYNVLYKDAAGKVKVLTLNVGDCRALKVRIQIPTPSAQATARQEKHSDIKASVEVTSLTADMHHGLGTDPSDPFAGLSARAVAELKKSNPSFTYQDGNWYILGDGTESEKYGNAKALTDILPKLSDSSVDSNAMQKRMVAWDNDKQEWSIGELSKAPAQLNMIRSHGDPAHHNGSVKGHNWVSDEAEVQVTTVSTATNPDFYTLDVILPTTDGTKIGNASQDEQKGDSDEIIQAKRIQAAIDEIVKENQEEYQKIAAKNLKNAQIFLRERIRLGLIARSLRVSPDNMLLQDIPCGTDDLQTDEVVLVGTIDGHDIHKSSEGDAITRLICEQGPKIWTKLIDERMLAYRKEAELQAKKAEKASRYFRVMNYGIHENLATYLQDEQSEVSGKDPAAQQVSLNTQNASLANQYQQRFNAILDIVTQYPGVGDLQGSMSTTEIADHLSSYFINTATFSRGHIDILATLTADYDAAVLRQANKSLAGKRNMPVEPRYYDDELISYTDELWKINAYKAFASLSPKGQNALYMLIASNKFPPPNAPVQEPDYAQSHSDTQTGIFSVRGLSSTTWDTKTEVAPKRSAKSGNAKMAAALGTQSQPIVITAKPKHLTYIRAGTITGGALLADNEWEPVLADVNNILCPTSNTTQSASPSTVQLGLAIVQGTKIRISSPGDQFFVVVLRQDDSIYCITADQTMDLKDPSLITPPLQSGDKVLLLGANQGNLTTESIEAHVANYFKTRDRADLETDPTAVHMGLALHLTNQAAAIQSNKPNVSIAVTSVNPYDTINTKYLMVASGQTNADDAAAYRCHRKIDHALDCAVYPRAMVGCDRRIQTFEASNSPADQRIGQVLKKQRDLANGKFGTFAEKAPQHVRDYNKFICMQVETAQAYSSVVPPIPKPALTILRQRVNEIDKIALKGTDPRSHWLWAALKEFGFIIGTLGFGLIFEAISARKTGRAWLYGHTKRRDTSSDARKTLRQLVEKEESKLDSDEEQNDLSRERTTSVDSQGDPRKRADSLDSTAAQLGEEDEQKQSQKRRHSLHQVG